VTLRGEPRPTPTAREVDLLRALYRTGSSKDAGVALGIARSTVKEHLSQLYRRLGVENAYEAAYALWLRDLWGEGTWGPRGAEL
jgi:DNA-binding NarL/FixJ family response regulator